MNSEIIIKTIDYRPCYVNGKKALFHKWTNNDIGCARGIIEYEDGTIDIVVPYEIKFCDYKLNEYAFRENNNV